MKSFFTGAIALSCVAALVAVAVLSVLGVAAPSVMLFIALLGIALLLAATLRWTWRDLPALPLRRGLAPAALAVLGVLALAACATAPAKQGTSLSAAQDGVAAAITIVHQAYTQGIISKAQVRKADQLADEADDASLAARKAYASGDATTAQGALGQLAALLVEIIALEKPQAQ